MPDNPSNINWENLEKGKTHKCSKICLSFVFILLFLLIVMIFNMLLQSFNSNYKKNSDGVAIVCVDTISDEVFGKLYEDNKEIILKSISERSETETAILENIEYHKKVECYCNQFNYFEIIQNQSTKYKYCKEIVLSYLKTISVSVATGFFISIVNFILVIIISNLILWIPFKSLSSQKAVQILLLTMGLIINTLVNFIFIVMIINYIFYNLS